MAAADVSPPAPDPYDSAAVREHLTGEDGGSVADLLSGTSTTPQRL